MRTLAFSVLWCLLAGCATLDSPPPLSGAEIVQLARTGKTAPEIIAELQRTNTVLPLLASDYAALHDEGVPDEVLNYLQSAQIEDALWRERSMVWGWNFPSWGVYYGRGSCRGRRC